MIARTRRRRPARISILRRKSRKKKPEVKNVIVNAEESTVESAAMKSPATASVPDARAVGAKTEAKTGSQSLLRYPSQLLPPPCRNLQRNAARTRKNMQWQATGFAVLELPNQLSAPSQTKLPLQPLRILPPHERKKKLLLSLHHCHLLQNRQLLPRKQRLPLTSCMHPKPGSALHKTNVRCEILPSCGKYVGPPANVKHLMQVVSASSRAVIVVTLHAHSYIAQVSSPAGY